jgi:hypothetical protein
MLGLDRGIAAGFYRRNERIGMPIVTVPGRRRQLRQEPTISVVCRAAHGFLRSTTLLFGKPLANALCKLLIRRVWITRVKGSANR